MAPIEPEKKEKKIPRWEPPTRDETAKEKFARKARENPFVPIGCLLTVGALGYGLVSFKRGDVRMQQYMMRARVAAQGFTILAVCGGLGYAVYRSYKKD
ncbi:HIG1 domain family member 2A, mitochondrial-like isoform X2 [Actinia tenebrosa]|uniref:HIG1 domain family member 2A, mitochondrial-like isoform X2 n=1 Tax=Actinia tenebrosa TaxID=6105 RepID=A0A6P8JGC5_ACTTE|nr:HIG1 domain family member 2A, mitochondrial-like isoform X2 [Actinia tenebrosa]